MQEWQFSFSERSKWAPQTRTYAPNETICEIIHMWVTSARNYPICALWVRAVWRDLSPLKPNQNTCCTIACFFRIFLSTPKWQQRQIDISDGIMLSQSRAYTHTYIANAPQQYCNAIVIAEKENSLATIIRRCVYVCVQGSTLYEYNG